MRVLRAWNPVRAAAFAGLLAAVGVGAVGVPGAASAAEASASPDKGAKAASAADLVPMGPGQVAGRLNTYQPKHGESVSQIAARYGVNPVRVTVPKDKTQRYLVDQRVVTPVFQGWVDGIVLNLPEAELYYVEHGKLIRQYPVAVSMSDWKMPIGQTKVKELEKNPTWHVPPKIQAEMAKKGLEVKTKVDPGPKNPLGARWIGVWDQTYGFHGTISPESMKRYASHGCVRMLNPDVIDLFRRVKLGTPVRVYYQPVTLAVAEHTVWLTVYPDIYDRGYDYRAAVKALAQQAHVGDRLNWKFVEQAIQKKNGILTSVSRMATPAPASPAASAAPANSPASPLRPATSPSGGPAPSAGVPATAAP